MGRKWTRKPYHSTTQAIVDDIASFILNNLNVVKGNPLFAVHGKWALNVRKRSMEFPIFIFNLLAYFIKGKIPLFSGRWARFARSVGYRIHAIVAGLTQGKRAPVRRNAENNFLSRSSLFDVIINRPIHIEPGNLLVKGTRFGFEWCMMVRLWVKRGVVVVAEDVEKISVSAE